MAAIAQTPSTMENTMELGHQMVRRLSKKMPLMKHLMGVSRCVSKFPAKCHYVAFGFGSNPLDPNRIFIPNSYNDPVILFCCCFNRCDSCLPRDPDDSMMSWLETCYGELLGRVPGLAFAISFGGWKKRWQKGGSRWWQLKYFYGHPYLGKSSNLTNIFQMGWNHQLGIV